MDFTLTQPLAVHYVDGVNYYMNPVQSNYSRLRPLFKLQTRFYHYFHRREKASDRKSKSNCKTESLTPRATVRWFEDFVGGLFKHAWNYWGVADADGAELPA